MGTGVIGAWKRQRLKKEGGNLLRGYLCQIKMLQGFWASSSSRRRHLQFSHTAAVSWCPGGDRSNRSALPRWDAGRVLLRGHCPTLLPAMKEYAMALALPTDKTSLPAGRIMQDPLPSVGLVIGTFAAMPYVHLQLESWRRNYPSVPLLVSDDCSPLQSDLGALCKTYRAHFLSRPYRGRWTVGDMTSYVNGFDWAARHGVDVLVKFSRRFIPLTNWVPRLRQLCDESQSATYSNQCRHFNFGFRTECIGFHVKTWIERGAADRIRFQVENNEPAFVEGFVHNLARSIQATSLCEANDAYVRAHPSPPDADAYAVWDIMAPARTTRRPDVLWHDCETPLDYARVARAYGLAYQEADFVDPNQGHGLGCA
jgi:hypothetical protein